MDLEKIKDIVIPVLKKYGVVSASIFGSYAREEQDDDSDIDILIEYAPTAKRTLITHMKMVNELKELLQKDVDVITESFLSPHLHETVMKEKKVIM